MCVEVAGWGRAVIAIGSVLGLLVLVNVAVYLRAKSPRRKEMCVKIQLALALGLVITSGIQIPKLS